MPGTTRPGGPRNLLLAALSEGAMSRLRPHLELVSPASGAALGAPVGPISHLYFPETGVASLMAYMRDGSAAEVGIVGNEGVVGLPALLGTGQLPIHAIWQVPGECLRVPVGIYRAEVDGNGAAHALLLRYTQSLMFQVAQAAACARLHPVASRCARWLLMTSDRVGSDQFQITHQFLAEMLGVHRPTLTLAAGRLAQAGAISYRRGHVRVLDRAVLEAASCECYETIRMETDRLLA